MLQTRAQQTVLKAETAIKDSLLSESDFQKAIVIPPYAYSSSSSLHFVLISIQNSTHSLFLESRKCVLQVVQKRAAIAGLLQKRPEALLISGMIFRGLPPKKNNLK